VDRQVGLVVAHKNCTAFPLTATWQPYSDGCDFNVTPLP
jgi:hypothetical protein